MGKKDIKKLAIAFVAILLLAIIIDMSEGEITKDGFVLRNETGDDKKELSLSINIDGTHEDYKYLLELEPVRPTKEQAEEYFASAILEIEKDFSKLSNEIPMKDTYQEGIVEARWNMDPWNVINADGAIVQEEIPAEGLIVNADVVLECGEYEQIYQFSFELAKKELSESEELFMALDEWVDTEMAKEGVEEFYLPQELNGMKLNWSENKDSLTMSIVMLEVVAIVLLIVMRKRKEEQERKELLRNLEMDYPEIVGQLSLLLGAGMNIRQAWSRIAMRYVDKRKKEQIVVKPAFEGIVSMSRRIQEGENEKVAYQQFANETNSMCYHRLIRLLIGNLEKGNGGICELLEQESKQAYEQRIIQAKKLGEEASMRMLLPLMLMMVVVMAIVMMPAVISFAG